MVEGDGCSSPAEKTYQNGITCELHRSIGGNCRQGEMKVVGKGSVVYWLCTCPYGKMLFWVHSHFCTSLQVCNLLAWWCSPMGHTRTA